MPTKSSTRTKTLTVRVGPSMRQAISDYASAREMTDGEFVRYCVRFYMDTVDLDPESDGIESDEEYERGQQDLAESGESRLEIARLRRGE